MHTQIWIKEAGLLQTCNLYHLVLMFYLPLLSINLLFNYITWTVLIKKVDQLTNVMMGTIHKGFYTGIYITVLDTVELHKWDNYHETLHRITKLDTHMTIIQKIWHDHTNIHVLIWKVGFLLIGWSGLIQRLHAGSQLSSEFHLRKWIWIDAKLHAFTKCSWIYMWIAKKED